MKITCISDLHGYYPKLEGGDLLIIAGNLTAHHYEEEFDEFMGWLDLYETDYKKIVIVAGDHDQFIQENPNYINSFEFENIEYLCDSGVEFDGLKLWGSPWTCKFKGINPKCCAFTLDNDEELEEKWKLIPDDIDILITNCPEYGMLDDIALEDGSLFHAGSTSLGEKTFTLKNLKLHVVGHIYEKYGIIKLQGIHKNKYKYINASHVNEYYKPINKPIQIKL
jgi:Icc-related predicted phosphoesterase